MRVAHVGSMATSVLPLSLWRTHRNALMARPRTFRLGMPVVGIVERPLSNRPSTNLISWDRATYADRAVFTPYKLYAPLHREAPFDQDLGAWLPQLGGQHYDVRNFVTAFVTRLAYASSNALSRRMFCALRRLRMGHWMQCAIM